jgi:hypothetical protein
VLGDAGEGVAPPVAEGCAPVITSVRTVLVTRTSLGRGESVLWAARVSGRAAGPGSGRVLMVFLPAGRQDHAGGGPGQRGGYGEHAPLGQAGMAELEAGAERGRAGHGPDPEGRRGYYPRVPPGEVRGQGGGEGGDRGGDDQGHPETGGDLTAGAVPLRPVVNAVASDTAGAARVSTAAAVAASGPSPA